MTIHPQQVYVLPLSHPWESPHPNPLLALHQRHIRRIVPVLQAYKLGPALAQQRKKRIQPRRALFLPRSRQSTRPRQPNHALPREQVTEHTDVFLIRY